MTKEPVAITVTVEVPKPAKELLEKFAKSTNTTLETIITENIMAQLTNFYNGGFYQAWTREAKDLAQEIEQQFDC